jgi:epoxyqueuosine reductase
MKILIHTCCAPCLIFPLERIRGTGASSGVFFYNPNIHPLSEYSARRQAVEDYLKGTDVEAFYPEYEPRDFFRAVNLKDEGLDRCRICWSLRLQAAARRASEAGFDFFTTTLLVSPYQSQEELKKLGEEAARSYGVGFYYEDFRPGFRDAHAKAKQAGIYCQKYCGCIYSEIERQKAKKAR